ncbi:hypothetical protein K490DRAFT_65043 [Saccharata proteae CBS 121410]|uniref:Yeast cell wall synthesis Kre9/Knh1-like N-terminal domain-containing protein n=1 Tax=Saccharata proteae CBS 121410 TaxID=1314787 RepID=A0A9P4LZQ7_9PEZI|nr:hypothetical protein K490DRAFT_65043 [Saccharata proteae CBS 121410]
MKTFTSILIAGLAATLSAALENPFIVPTSGFEPVAGQDVTINWKPTAGKTVTLILRSGASSNLMEGEAIVEKTDNTGSYTWTVPSSVVRGSDYTIEIVDDDDTSQTNYFPYFVIDSNNTVPASSHISLPTYTYGAPTSTDAALSSAAATTAKTTVSAASASTTASSDSMNSGSMSMSTMTTSKSAAGSSSTDSSSASTASGSAAEASATPAPTSGAAALSARAAGALLAIVAAGFAFAL